MHRGPKQAGGIFRRARDDDTQTRIMRQCGFVGLAVPQTSSGKICSVGRINYQGTFPVTEWTPAQSRDVGHQLIETRIDKINELQFENGSLAVSGQAATDTKDRRLGQGRIENLVGKLGRKFLC